MTKDVVISVRGLQVMDNESAEDIETVQQGEYFERNGKMDKFLRAVADKKLVFICPKLRRNRIE